MLYIETTIGESGTKIRTGGTLVSSIVESSTTLPSDISSALATLSELVTKD